MGQRLELQSLLEEILGTVNPAISENVYFQPPGNVQMKYPCIVYTRDDIDTEFAGNKPYLLTKRYLVTVMDRNPDSLIPDKIAVLPMCVYSRRYVANGLNHDAFNLYF